MCATSVQSSTVYVMRHCSRSTYFPDLEYVDRYKYLANYSDGGPLPSWGVGPSLCTQRGRKIVMAQGKNLAAEFQARTSSAPLKVVFDAGATRDNTTAHDFLAGLGLPESLAHGDAAIFNPQKAGYCPYPTAAEYRGAIAERLMSVPAPDDLDDLLSSLQGALGAGAAPPISSMKNTISAEGYWIGGIYVASSWVEAMLLQLGAGVPVGYGRVSPELLYRLLKLHVYYRAVNDRGFVVEQRGQSNILAHMLDDLTPVTAPPVPAERATLVEQPPQQDGLMQAAATSASLYVGHDTQLDGLAALLNLTWAAPPYPRDTTPPGAILRLTRTGDGDAAYVEASLLYTSLEDEKGEMLLAATAFANGDASMPLATFEAAVRHSIDWSCVRKAR